MTKKQTEKLLETLKSRFDAHKERHRGISWNHVEEKLRLQENKLLSLSQMEETGGEPDVVAYNKKARAFIFFDCSPESPKGRRSLCYDKAARASRKEFKPNGSALEVAESMGIDILTEDQYRTLQTLGVFDTKTSSWVLTPSPIRKHGGAIFCDRRYDAVFTYHNGAESYYASRGFRGTVTI